MRSTSLESRVEGCALETASRVRLAARAGRRRTARKCAHYFTRERASRARRAPPDGPEHAMSRCAQKRKKNARLTNENMLQMGKRSKRNGVERVESEKKSRKRKQRRETGKRKKRRDTDPVATRGQPLTRHVDGDSDNANQLLRKLHEVERRTRDRFFDAGSRKTDDDIEVDLFVATFNTVEKKWSYEREVRRGCVVFRRIQLLFSPLSVEGFGMNEDGDMSKTMQNLTTRVLEPIAAGFARLRGDSGVEISFIIGNALPTLRYMSPKSAATVGQTHLDFDPKKKSHLGCMSFSRVKQAVRAHVGAMNVECMNVEYSLDVHSAKTHALLDDELKQAILACDGTFGKHPTTFTDQASVVLLQKLEKEGVDVSLSRGGIGFQDLVCFDVTPDVLEKRVPKKDELKKKLAAIPTAALYGFQRVAVELVCQAFISGQPGALVSLDVGFGKTIIMLATTYVLLASNSVQRVVWVLQKFQMLDSDETDETGVVIAQLLSFLRKFLSMEEAAAFAARIDVVLAGQQTAHETALTESLDAALRVGDAAVFVDEASLYLGGLTKPTKMHVLLDSYDRGSIFTVALTATPMHSYAERIYSLVTFIGGRVERGNHDQLRECCSTAVTQFYRGDESAISSVRKTLESVHVSLERVYEIDGSTKAEVSRLVKGLGIERGIVFVRNDDERLETSVDDVFRGLATSGARLYAADVLALSPNAFRAIYVADDAADESDEEWDGGVSRLAEALASHLSDALGEKSKEKALVFFSSDVLAAMCYTYHEFASLGYADIVGMCDGATDDAERARLFDAVNDNANPLRVLFMTDRVGGFGLDARNVRSAIYVGSPWSDANVVQALGRVLRVCAADRPHEKTRIIHFIPVSRFNGTLLKRFARSNARGTFFGAIFPSVVHGDRRPLKIKKSGVLLRSSVFTEQGREKFADEFGVSFLKCMDGEDIKSFDYKEGIKALNKALKSTSKHLQTPSFDFMIEDGSTRERASADSTLKKAKKKKQGAKSQACANAANGIHVMDDKQRRKATAERFCSQKRAKLPQKLSQRVESTQEKAIALATSLTSAAATLKQYGAEAFTVSALSNNDSWLVYDPESDVQKELRAKMIFASAWARKSREWNRSAFPAPREVSDEMQYGLDKEAGAIEHIASKYSFDLLPDVKSFTKVHRDCPDMLAASADAITVDGVILEIKCIADRDNFLDRVAFRGQQELRGYLDQVQAQLEVYDLELGLLCLCHESDGSWLSVEYPILRDAKWFENNKVEMKREIEVQKQRLRRQRRHRAPKK